MHDLYGPASQKKYPYPIISIGSMPIPERVADGLCNTELFSEKSCMNGGCMKNDSQHGAVFCRLGRVLLHGLYVSALSVHMILTMIFSRNLPDVHATRLQVESRGHIRGIRRRA